MEIHVFSFSLHVVGYSFTFRCVLLSSSHIWRHNCTCSRFHILGTCLHILMHASQLRVELRSFHFPQGTSYIFRGILDPKEFSTNLSEHMRDAPPFGHCMAAKHKFQVYCTFIEELHGGSNHFEDCLHLQRSCWRALYHT